MIRALLRIPVMKAKIFLGKRSPNADQVFKTLAREKGWRAVKAGWPDFLLIQDGKPVFVEVKSFDDRLHSNQLAMFAALEAVGIVVRIWWQSEPDTLIPWRKFDERTGAAARRREARRKAKQPRRYSGRELSMLEWDAYRGKR